MAFKGPFQPKLVYDAVGSFSKSTPLRTMPFTHKAGSGLVGFKPVLCCPKGPVQCSKHQWHGGAINASWWLLCHEQEERYLGTRAMQQALLLHVGVVLQAAKLPV